MSKLVKVIIAIGAVALLSVGCISTNNNDQIIKNDTIDNEENIDKADNQEVSEKKTDSESQTDIENEGHSNNNDKEIYLSKLNTIEEELDKELKEKYDTGVTLEMLEASNRELEVWDEMLNEIYSKLKTNLSDEDFNKLKEEELNWINIRDEKSESAAKEFEGGSFERVNRISSLVVSTKERCYELVNQYMDKY